jgi:GNAT superfamily N-acetyltransferase
MASASYSVQIQSTRRASKESSVSFTIRDLTEADAPRATSLVNFATSEPISVAQVRERLVAGRSDDRMRLGAFDETGMLVGYGHAVREAWMGDLFWLHVVVDPAARRQGAGSHLYDALREFAVARGVTTLRGEVRDTIPEGLRFAERRGCRIDRHIFESTLDLAIFDERPFTAALDRALASGIRFRSLADRGDTPEARRRLYELERVVARDVPGGSESAVRPFEAFLHDVCDAPHYRADGQLIAADGEGDERWVGLAAVLHYPETNSMYNGITGVLPSYRSRGIAQALKLLAIRVARRHGVAYIRTNNDSENAPMLAINRKMGYTPEPGYYRMRADLAPGG